MGEKILVGPIGKGLKKDREPFVIDNDAFPVLINSYQWRGRIKRKRGTALLNRLERYFDSTSTAYNSGSTTITLNGSGTGNLLTGFSLQSDGNIVPTTVTVTAPGPTVYTDPAGTGALSPSGSINYATGAITIAAEAGNAVSAKFNYYPDLPVLGLRDYFRTTQGYQDTLGFDTTYAYNILTNSPHNIYSISFYKNPITATYAGYTEKTTVTPTTWNSATYQQMWTVNYQGALWATNGLEVPFQSSSTNVGMQFKRIITVTVNTATTATLNITAHGLVVGDFVFINEVVTTTGINFQTGYVTTVVGINDVTVTFPNATIATNGTGGIAQYLTSRADTTIDCLRWYDGDPTDGVYPDPALDAHKGWVNFMPPLSEEIFSISDEETLQYYLVGAKIIVPFKDRLCFFGPIIQTSSGSPIYLQDTVIYSQNGTPYYTASFTGDPADTSTVFNPILVPTNQSGAPTAYWEDQTGYGGFKSTGVQQPITTISSNEDVLLVGFTTFQSRLVYSGNDLDPFNFFVTNSELGSGSTFSSINLDQGALSRGSRGFVIASQNGAQRFDLDIPDEVFDIALNSNGAERVTAQRDFANEWVYFSYPSDSFSWVFPTRTLQYNYRDNTWGMFNETYTSYGSFRISSGLTWSTVGAIYPTWSVWNNPWNSSVTTEFQPRVIGGNQQGFVMFRGIGTGEGNSLYIRSISSFTITSPDHCLNSGDYIIISGCLGSISSTINSRIFEITVVDEDSFTITVTDGGVAPSGTYSGGGLIKRMYVPFIQTRQFPVSWGIARKTRLGPQHYLFTTTNKGQITLLIFLSQNADDPYNNGGVVPNNNVDNSSLVYSTVLYTCPESTNLGLTPANVNLNLITAQQQQQTWHRMNTSLLGDTVQIGFTLSHTQMVDTDFKSQFEEIELQGFLLDVSPSSMLA